MKISKREDLFTCFGHAVCSDDADVKNGKPAPDIYLVTAQRFTNHPKSNENVSYSILDVTFLSGVKHSYVLMYGK